MRILFVCSGNTCRSPLAAAIARKLAAERGLMDVEIQSAGTGAFPNSPASEGTMLVSVERGLDVASHRAQMLTKELVDQSDVILTMSRSHLESARALGGGERSFLLDDFASRGAEQGGVPDPYGGSLDDYRETADTLTRLIDSALGRIAMERSEKK
jgi:protein-tyrosine phosphatase